MRLNWKKTITATLDVFLAGYLILAFTEFNKPDETKNVCTKVTINIQDEATNGFINTQEIKHRLEANNLYPLEKPMRYVDARKIEEMRSEEHTSELQSRQYLVCRLLLEKKRKINK